MMLDDDFFTEMRFCKMVGIPYEHPAAGMSPILCGQSPATKTKYKDSIVWVNEEGQYLKRKGLIVVGPLPANENPDLWMPLETDLKIVWKKWKEEKNNVRSTEL